MQITKKQSLQLCIEMWTWLAETGSSKKSEAISAMNWPAEIKNFVGDNNECAACAYDVQCGGGCRECPIWSWDDHLCGDDRRSVYMAWWWALSIEDKKRYAAEVAELAKQKLNKEKECTDAFLEAVKVAAAAEVNKAVNKIKVIEGLKPWEIMKAASEGKRIAFSFKGACDWSVNKCPVWNWSAMDYAVIDDSQPVIQWDEFDWEFFNQYGGLPVIRDYKNGTEPTKMLGVYDDSVLGLHESPFYPWFGGKQPVPDNVEVEGIYRNEGASEICSAKTVRWGHEDSFFQDVIAFRLTGNVVGGAK